MKKLLLAFLMLLSGGLVAQEYFPNNESVAQTNTNFTALTHAKIHVNPTTVLDDATLLIHKGKVVQVGKNVSLPRNTTVLDLKGKSIYPSFIDVYSDFGIEKPQRASGSGRSNEYDPSRSGYYWNDHVMPEKMAVDHFSFDDKKAADLLQAGFGLVNAHVPDGIIRGTGVLVALNAQSDKSMQILNSRSAQYFSMDRSVATRQSYPSSIMGSMALIRQVYIDANWYARGMVETKDLSLEAFIDNKNLPQIFVANNRMNALRADKVGDENGVQYVLVGGGDEYERIEEVKNTKATFVIPLNFPDAYDVENPFMASALTLAEMRQWNQMPTNPMVLAKNAVPFALTAHGLKSPKEFMAALRKAIAYGLTETDALAALTTVPAGILGKSNEIGTLSQGAYANFMVVSGSIFKEDSVLYEHWIQGRPNVFEDKDTPDLRGQYTFNLMGESYEMNITGIGKKMKADVKANEQSRGTKINFDNRWIYLTLTDSDSVKKQFIRMYAKPLPNKNIKGKALLPNGVEVDFSAQYESSDSDKESDAKKDPEVFEVMPVTYPNKAYGFTEKPEQQTILFQNATVWTNETVGVLKQTDVLVKDGKIAKIGQNLSVKNAQVWDATGKHLTAGIIDEHAHIATSSVNEGGQNSSAEVSIKDVLDPTDIDIYHNLAGGVTSIQVLHGSANPIGGRSAIIKTKWGETADGLLNKNAPKFIKFALGENVKQSNWGSQTRFPQTRMGVEQVFMDYFTRAKEYDALVKSGKPYRRDLDLEVVAEILNKERYITCHSYVQSEINMLMKVAERFGFSVNTFTHILEGYKVADKMKQHGVGASTFSDWWAYKFEVNDAIPYNAAIMHQVGLTVAINSDDAEMSRRLNQEAAKAVKYGGVSEEEALKMVTLNPAKLLHIDDRVGSISVGKDADLVLWSDHPLSVYAKAEKTLIEGVVYFDVDRDKQLRESIENERRMLIGQMLKAKNKGLKTQPVKKKEDKHFHCDTMDINLED